MSLSYRVTFLCNGCSKLIIHQKVLYDTFFIKKLVKWCNEIQDEVKTENLKRDFNRARYSLQHPYNMGGNPEHFKLRVKRDYLSRVVDMFSYEIEIIPNSITETTVDIKVRASQEGMKRLLLFHYDAVEILAPGDKFEEQLLEAVNALCEKYLKK